MNVNEGHRERLRQRFMTSGTSMQDHEILELLLFQSLPRRDTNKIAHELINKFGSFSNVFDATPAQLATVKGVSLITATNLIIIKETWQRYKQSKLRKQSLDGVSNIVRFAQNLLNDTSTERFVVVFVDNAVNYLTQMDFESNSIKSVSVDLRNIVSTAMSVNAAGAVIFHCHVRGNVEPSKDDMRTTEHLHMALAGIKVLLMEHLIINDDGQYFSFLANGYMHYIANDQLPQKQRLALIKNPPSIMGNRIKED